MQALYVFYDAQCRFCVRCAQWLMKQATYVPLSCIAAGSREALERFPDLDKHARKEELMVVDDGGGIYTDTAAWLMTLWAMVEYRAWAFRLSQPHLAPLARGLFSALSSGRHVLSLWLGEEDERLGQLIASNVPVGAMSCSNEGCAPRTNGGHTRCPSCGGSIPLGRQYCPGCLAKALHDDGSLESPR